MHLYPGFCAESGPVVPFRAWDYVLRENTDTRNDGCAVPRMGLWDHVKAAFSTFSTSSRISS